MDILQNIDVRYLVCSLHPSCSCLGAGRLGWGLRKTAAWFMPRGCDWWPLFGLERKCINPPASPPPSWSFPPWRGRCWKRWCECHLVHIVILEPVSSVLVFSLGWLFFFFKCILLPSSPPTLMPSTKNERKGMFSCGWFRRCERPDVWVNFSTFSLHALCLLEQL